VLLEQDAVGEAQFGERSAVATTVGMMVVSEPAVAALDLSEVSGPVEAEACQRSVDIHPTDLPRVSGCRLGA
jgi:hypothetical protein